MARHNTPGSGRHPFPFSTLGGGGGSGYTRIDEDESVPMTPPTPTTPISPSSVAGSELTDFDRSSTLGKQLETS